VSKDPWEIDRRPHSPHSNVRMPRPAWAKAPPAPKPKERRPAIGITVGDPAGIGPEIAIKAAADPRVTAVCEPRIYGPHEPAVLSFFPRGRLSADSGKSAYETIVRAVADVRRGTIAAIATGPINKEAFALAGLPWKGHTDLLAALTQTPRVAMMFHSEPLRVILATVHVPLADVPRLLTDDLVDFTIDVTSRELPRFGYAKPRIALAGLNPHAGEHGVIGGEDAAVLRPAVDRARARGIDITGPWPGDTVFARASRGEFDAVIACYHDQGLIPVKLLAFGRAVNVTIGLPIVRTSVDHGTAFDIAGKGTADHSSLVEAVLLAARLAHVRESGR
jgi:4-phospho-D-threonate 3-dehydrogenase / 4-phospho-D-erythronate 3-dehydrogenase